VGGWVFSLFGGQGVTGFNLPYLLIAFVVAVIVLAEFNLIFRRKLTSKRKGFGCCQTLFWWC
jgi:uncharacterized membrane protein YeaQ/YmgE (transglycosylase-associated protein family)